MRIVVGISGGVDSALAAALLNERGFDVVGCFLKVAVAGAPCPWKEDLPMAHRVAAFLNIPLVTRDVSAEYARDVLEPMVAAYRRGETPNPDTTCNRYVKFDALTAVARDVGAERVATGHYVRTIRSRAIASEAKPSAEIPFTPAPGLLRRAAPRNDIALWRGLDHIKDQSYFLWMLTPEQLAMCEFPLGAWKKENVRAEAKRRGFPNWNRESTSGVCFLGQVDLAEFLEARTIGTPATVVTTSGEVMGSIPNIEALTIGQRAPIAGQSAPRYVVSSNVAAQQVVVSSTPEDPARYTAVVHAVDPHWIGSTPVFPLRCTARIRHRQEPIHCTVTTPASFRPSEASGEIAKRSNRDLSTTLHSARDDANASGLQVALDTPLTGVAPGQAVVFTDGDRVLGGAVITRP